VAAYFDVRCLVDRNVRKREEGGKKIDSDPPPQTPFLDLIDFIIDINYDWLKSNNYTFVRLKYQSGLAASLRPPHVHL
jgi:hypothetical protein